MDVKISADPTASPLVSTAVIPVVQDGTNKKTTVADIIAGSEKYHGIEALGAKSFDNSTHVFSLASVTYWYKGTKFTTASAVTCDLDSFVTLTTDSAYFVYFDDASGTLKASASAWNLHEVAPVAILLWNGSVGIIGHEHHNHTRDIDWHNNAHSTIGTRYQSGLAQTLPSTTTDNQISIGSGTIWDEDIQLNISASTSARLWYQTATGYHFETTPVTVPYKLNGSQIQYLDTDTFALTDIASNRYGITWVYATSDTVYPIYLLVGSAATSYASVSDARAALPPNLASSPFNPESKLIYKWIFAGDGQYQEGADYRQSSTLPAGGTAATSAAAVTFTPAGNIAAATVQSAIEELDTEKAPVANGVTNGDSHDHSGGDGAQIAYSSLSGLPSIPSITGLLDETAHDALDHTGLTGIPAAYTLPTASTTVLGGVKVDGTSVTINNGVISSSATGGADIPYQNDAPTSPSDGDLWVDKDAVANVTGIDWASPVSVTTTATLTIGKHHVCSGTTADYTITLPAVSGNEGRLISVEMSGALTKLVTVDGNASETIDGATTRIMWASETAILLCDGTQWTKVAGKSIPMQGYLYANSFTQLFAAATATKLQLASFSGNPFLNDAANYQIKIPRVGRYSLSYSIHYSSTNATVGSNTAMVCYNGSNISNCQVDAYRPASASVPVNAKSISLYCGEDIVLALYGYFAGGSFTTSTIFTSSITGRTGLQVEELITW